MDRDERRRPEPDTASAVFGAFIGALTGVYGNFDLDALRDEWSERSARDAGTQLRA